MSRRRRRAGSCLIAFAVFAVDGFQYNAVSSRDAPPVRASLRRIVQSIAGPEPLGPNAGLDDGVSNEE